MFVCAQSKSELASVYAALILYDEGAEISVSARFVMFTPARRHPAAVRKPSRQQAACMGHAPHAASPLSAG